jgi:hypothetical protein
MALPSSGEIKMSQINTELGRASNSSIALNSAEDGGYAAINQCSPNHPNPNNPSTMSEWYGYNHSASCTGLPTIYLDLYVYINQSGVSYFQARASQSCGGSLINGADNPGDIYVYFQFTAINQTFTGGCIILEGQNTANFNFPLAYGTPTSWNITSIYIVNGAAQLINCEP